MGTRKIPHRRAAAVTITLLLLTTLLITSLNHSQVFVALRERSLNDPTLWDYLIVFVKNYAYWLAIGYITLLCIMLFLENNNPDRTLAWLLVMIAVPVVGVILYWVVGPNFRYLANKRRFRLAQSIVYVRDLYNNLSTPLIEDTCLVLNRSSGAKLYSNCSVRLLIDGQATFDAMLQALQQAQHSILIESYIVENDEIGNQVKDILIAKATAGVFVCLLYDAVGSWRIGKKYVRQLRQANVHAIPFLPVAFPMLRGANYRNHRKIAIIDKQTAFMGGLNIGDAYLGKDPHFGYWRDTHIQLQGPAVDALVAIFLKDLSISSASEEVKKSAAQTHLPASQKAAGTTQMQVVASGPDTAWDTIHKAYFSLICRSRKRVWITTPYLVPGDTLLDALCMAALTGVDVRILLPAKSDHILVHWATLHSCEELLRAGARIFLYDKDRFVHAKTFVCDDQVFSVGSANVDMRSLQINFEVQAFIYDAQLNQKGASAFETDLQHSKELALAEWEQRSIWEKIKENIGKLFSSLL